MEEKNASGTHCRPTRIPDFKWAKCLLQRADFIGWRTNLEFVASLYNVLLRRAQLRAVHLVVVQKSLLTSQDQEMLASVTAKDFITEALHSGECESLRKFLYRSGLREKLQKTAHMMDLAFRHVRGSESEKLTMRKRFVAMRVWNGFSSLFFTLNPHDIRSPMTLVLVTPEHFHMEPFSLDFNDADTEAYLARLLGQHPRRLHEIVALMCKLEAFLCETCFFGAYRALLSHVSVRLGQTTAWTSKSRVYQP